MNNMQKAIAVINAILLLLLLPQLALADVSRETLAPRAGDPDTQRDMGVAGAGRLVEKLDDAKALAQMDTALRATLPRRVYKKVVPCAAALLRIVQNEEVLQSALPEGHTAFFDGRMPALQRELAPLGLKEKDLFKIKRALQKFSLTTGIGLRRAQELPPPAPDARLLEQLGFQEANDQWALRFGYEGVPRRTGIGPVYAADLMEEFLKIYEEKAPYDPSEFKDATPMFLYEKLTEIPSTGIAGAKGTTLTEAQVRLIKDIIMKDGYLCQHPELITLETVFANLLTRLKASVMDREWGDMSELRVTVAKEVDDKMAAWLKELLNDFGPLLAKFGYTSFEIQTTQAPDASIDTSAAPILRLNVPHPEREGYSPRKIVLTLQNQIMNLIPEDTWQVEELRLKRLSAIEQPSLHAKNWRTLHVLSAMHGGVSAWQTLAWLCSYMPELALRLADGPYFLGEGLSEYVLALYYQDQQDLATVPPAVQVKLLHQKFRLLGLARQLARAQINQFAKAQLLAMLVDVDKDPLMGRIASNICGVDAIRALVDADKELSDMVSFYPRINAVAITFAWRRRIQEYRCMSPAQREEFLQREASAAQTGMGHVSIAREPAAATTEQPLAAPKESLTAESPEDQAARARWLEEYAGQKKNADTSTAGRTDREAKPGTYRARKQKALDLIANNKILQRAMAARIFQLLREKKVERVVVLYFYYEELGRRLYDIDKIFNSEGIEGLTRMGIRGILLTAHEAREGYDLVWQRDMFSEGHRHVDYDERKLDPLKYEDRISYKNPSGTDKEMFEQFVGRHGDTIKNIVARALSLYQERPGRWDYLLRYLGANLEARNWEPSMNDFIERVKGARLAPSAESFWIIAGWYAAKDAVWDEQYQCDEARAIEKTLPPSISVQVFDSDDRIAKWQPPDLRRVWESPAQTLPAAQPQELPLEDKLFEMAM